MKEKSFLKKKTGRQTIVGLITILSFPFLYFGQMQNNRITMFIGMGLIICGMLSSPIIKLMYKDNN